MSHLFKFKTSYSLQFQAVMDQILNSGGDTRPHLTSLFYRVGDTNSSDTGKRHGGIDFNYESANLNGFGVSDVSSPITGVLVRRDPREGSIFIQEDGTKIVHAIYHLDSFSQSVLALDVDTGVVTAGMVLGRMGGRGYYDIVDGVRVNYKRQAISNQNIDNGADAYPPHVHYEVLLPGFVANDGATWNRIDPIVYWTRGVNPTTDSSTTGTGLYAYANPVNDVNGNGTIDDTASGAGISKIGAVVKEGGRSYLRVGINTPHTRSIELRIQFSNAPAGFRVVNRTGAYAVEWNDTEKAAYVTLPATGNQFTPNTSTIIELYMPEESDPANTTNEFVTYSVTAGYLVTDTSNRSLQYWYDYNRIGRIFTPAENRTLTILDNDTPAPPSDIRTPVHYTNIEGVVTIYNGGPLSDHANSNHFADYNGDGKNDLTNIVGTPGADKLNGLAGDDRIYGEGGLDFLYGDEGNDSIHANETLNGTDINTDAYLDGGAGNDNLFSGGGNDYLIGGPDTDADGRDWLYGHTGNDTLKGGGGDDVLVGGMGRDLLMGGKGNDYLFAGGQRAMPQYVPWYLMWSITPVSEVIANAPQNGNYFFYFDVGYVTGDILARDPSGNILFGEEGQDYLSGGSGDDYLDGGKDSDVLIAFEGNDILVGGEGDSTDYLAGGYGNDMLYGGKGNDFLWGDTIAGSNQTGSEGNDVLDGGTGDDRLFGEGGNDTYIFGRGYGKDVIFDTAGRDVILFGEGIVAPFRSPFSSHYGVNIVVEGSDLIFQLIDGGRLTGDQVTVSNWSNSANQVEYVQFADGTILDARAMAIAAGAGTTANDSIIVALTGGYLAYRSQPSPPSPVSAYHFRLDADEGDDVLIGAETNEILIGGIGNDSLDGGAGNDALRGGAGNDLLYGGWGNDTYIAYARGEGQDVIFDYGGWDSLQFGPGIQREDVSHVRTGENLVLSIAGSTDQYTLTNWFSPNYRIEFLGFDDGSVITDADILKDYGIWLGRGDGPLADSSTNDTVYRLNLGPDLADGFNITISDAGGVDRLVFERTLQNDPAPLVLELDDPNYGNVEFGDPAVFKVNYLTPLLENAYRDGNDLVLEVYLRPDVRPWPDVHGSVRIQDYYLDSGNIELIDISGRVFGPAARDVFDTSVDPDAWTQHLLNGVYINAFSTYGLYELFDPGNPYYGIRSALTVGTHGDDGVGSWSPYFRSILASHMGDDGLLGKGNHDALSGGPGNDYLRGGGGSDVYWINPAEADRVFDDTLGHLSWGDLDTIRVPNGLALSDLVFAKDGNDLLIGSARVERFFERVTAETKAWNYEYPYMIEQLVGESWRIDAFPQYLVEIGLFGDYVGSDSGDRLLGDVFDNEIHGLGGNDYLFGGTGNDILNGGAGFDLLYQGRSSYYNYADRNVYDGGAGNDVLAAGEGGDAYRVYRGGGLDRVVDTGRDLYRGERGAFAYELSRLDAYEGDLFAPVVDLESFIETSFYGLPPALQDRLQNFLNNASTPGAFTKADAASIMNDTLAWISSDQDDSIIFGEGITPENIRVKWYGGERDDQDIEGNPTTYPVGTLHLDLGEGEGVIIHEAEDSPAHGVEFFRFTDGRVLTLAEMIARDPNPTLVSFPSNVTTDGNDLFVGDLGQQSFDGGDGDDVFISGGTAYDPSEDTGDSLYGGTGNDVYHFNVFETRAVYIEDEGVAFTGSGSIDTLSFGQGVSPADVRAYMDYFEPGNGAFEATLYLATDNYSEPMTIAWQYVYDDGAGNLTRYDHRLENIQFIGDNRLAAYDLVGLVAARWEELKAATSGSPLALFDYANLSDFDITATAGLAGGEAVYNHALTGSLFVSPYTHIAGTAGNDTLLAGKGGSTIDARDGDDVLISGTGDDRLVGGAGSDTYVFNIGNGSDVIVDSSAPGEINQIVFGPGVSPDSVTLGLGSLLLRYGIAGDQIHLDNFDPANVHGRRAIDRFVFDDGTVLTYEELLSRGFDIVGTPGDDVLTGTNINDRLIGGAGNDILLGGTGNDLLEGGPGADILVGGARDDVYVFNVGYGQDVIDDISGSDRIEFGAGIDPRNAGLNQDGDDLLLDLGDGDQIRIADWFRGNVIEFMQFDNGQVWSVDYIVRLLGGDPGNAAPVLTNPLPGQLVDEDITFSYTIPIDAFSDPDGDSLSYSATLADGTALPAWLSFDPATRTFSGTPLNDDVGVLEIRVTATDGQGESAFDDFTLTVNNVNDAPVLANAVPDQSTTEGQAFSFTLDPATFADDDAIHGDTLTFSASLADGSVLPAWLSFDPGTRTFSGTAPGDSTVTGTEGDDVLVSNDADVVHNIRVTATDTGGLSASDDFDLAVRDASADDVYDGRGGNDLLDTGIGNDTLIGGAGNDILLGGSGNDTYVYNLGDGLDTLTDTDGVDTLRFGAGITAEQVVMRIGTADGLARLRFLDADGCETTDQGIDITLNADGSLPIESVVFADGSSPAPADLVIQALTWYGTNRKDAIATGRHDDTIYGGNADDELVAGSGNDTLYGDNGDDRLYGQGGHDTLTGGRGDDLLDGGCGDDTLIADQGEDTLIGGHGNDTILLGEGEHTILFGIGDGQDVIKTLASDDDDHEAGAEVEFGAGIDPYKLWFARRADDLTVQVLGAGHGITIEGWYSSKHRPIDEFKTNDGSELEGKQIEQLVQAMAQFAPNLSADGTLPVDQQQELNAVIAAAWE